MTRIPRASRTDGRRAPRPRAFATGAFATGAFAAGGADVHAPYVRAIS